MKNLMKWSKVSHMLAPKLADEYKNYYLIMGQKPTSAAEVRANYKTIKTQISDAVEIQVNDGSYLLIPSHSQQVEQAETLVSRIKTEVYLDTKNYEAELAVDNLHHQKPHLNCALCYKPLSSDRSRFSNLGPVCEHRLNQIVEEEVSSVPSEWSSVYAEEVEQGEIVWVKTKAGETLVEIMSIAGEDLVIVDRKGLERELSTNPNTNYTAALKKYMQNITKKDIQGLSRLAPKKAEASSTMFADLMKDLFND
jgi:hypothetical protein